MVMVSGRYDEGDHDDDMMMMMMMMRMMTMTVMDWGFAGTSVCECCKLLWFYCWRLGSPP